MADIIISKFRIEVPRDGATPSTPGFAVSEGQDPVNPPGTTSGVFVPYSGATQSFDLGEFGMSAGFMKYDTTPTNTPTDQGTTYWDEDDNTVAIVMNGSIQKVGEDSFYPVKNQSGSTIAKGVAVRFAGTVGASGRLLIEPFIANGSVQSSRFMGVTMEEILNGEDGKVLWFGRLRGINTNAFNEGDILYASTTSAGGFQTAIPVAPNNIVQVAAVVTKSINNGTIFVRPTISGNINKTEGVKIVSPTTGDLLQLQSGGLWENKSLLNAGIIGGSITSGQVAFGTASGVIGGDSALLWDNTNKKVQVAGKVELRASTTASAATHIPVFTADPASTTRELVTRTPSQFRSDIGAGLRVSNGIYTANSAYVAHTGTGGTSYFALYTLPYSYSGIDKFHTWSIKGSVSFTSAYPVFVFKTGSDDSNSVNFSGLSNGDYRYEIDVCTVSASNTRLKITLTVKLFNDTNVWQRIINFDRTVTNLSTTPLDAMVNCNFSASNAGNFINVYDLRVVESPYNLSDNYING
jgi:hypothetical protein